MRVGVEMNAQIWHTNFVYCTPSLTIYFQRKKKPLKLETPQWGSWTLNLFLPFQLLEPITTSGSPPKSLGIPPSLPSARLESFFSGVFLTQLFDGTAEQDVTFLKDS